MPEKFMTWLNEEIKNLENEHTESNQFIWGKHAEAVRIRAMMCQIYKKEQKDGKRSDDDMGLPRQP